MGIPCWLALVEDYNDDQYFSPTTQLCVGLYFTMFSNKALHMVPVQNEFVFSQEPNLSSGWKLTSKRGRRQTS